MVQEMDDQILVVIQITIWIQELLKDFLHSKAILKKLGLWGGMRYLSALVTIASKGVYYISVI